MLVEIIVNSIYIYFTVLLVPWLFVYCLNLVLNCSYCWVKRVLDALVYLYTEQKETLNLHNCSFTVFHSLWSLWNEWPVLSICSIAHFSLLASCLLLRCALLVFLFHYLVHCSHIIGDPLFGDHWRKGILETLLSWIDVGMILFFHGLLPLP